MSNILYLFKNENIVNMKNKCECYSFFDDPRLNWEWKKKFALFPTKLDNNSLVWFKNYYILVGDGKDNDRRIYKKTHQKEQGE